MPSINVVVAVLIAAIAVVVVVAVITGNILFASNIFVSASS